jgi:hypothetical protein
MMLVESRRRQGFVGEGSAPFGQVVKGSLQVGFLAAFFLFAPALVFPLGLQVFVEHLEKLGVVAAAKVLRRDATAPANAPVGIGSTVPVDHGHLYYAPLRAPVPARSRRNWAFSSLSCWSSRKSSSV